MSLQKHRSPELAMTDPTVLRWYRELYHDAVADIYSMLNVAKMRQMNQGFVTMTAALGEGHIATLRSYWERLTAIRAPEAIKRMAVLDGTPFLDLFERAVHVRFWRYDARTWKPSITYTNGQTYIYYGGGTSTQMDQTVASLNAIITVLEGVSATNQADLTKMLDLIEMSSFYEKTKGVFTQGLPSVDTLSLPGFIENVAALNDIYTRALGIRDTHGLSGDEAVLFPVMGDAELGGYIPVVGYGKDGLNEWTLFGAPKFGALNATADLKSNAIAGNWIMFGTSFWIATDFNPVSPTWFEKNVYGYTREDGFVEHVPSDKDFGDGGDLASLMNGVSLWPFNHAFGPMAFAGQLDAAMEYRFLDKRQYDFTIYLPPQDLCLNQATTIASIFGIPSALS
jgi:hypothetical protein